MRVGTAETEAGHASNPAAGVARPLARISHHLNVLSVKVHVAVRAVEVGGCRNRVVLERLQHLDQRHHTRGGFRVADVGLRRPQQHRVSSRAVASQNAAQSRGLNRVTQDGAGAVGLNKIHVGRVNVRVQVGALQHVHLRIRVRRGQAVGVAVRVGGGALDHGDDIVAVRNRIRHALEHHKTCGLGAHDTVCVIRKRLDRTGRRNHAELREHQRRKRVGQHVHATSQRHVALVLTQRAHRVVGRHQRRRARGVHVHAGATEVESIRNAVRDNRTGRTGQRIGVCLRRVRTHQHPVIIRARTHEHTDRRAAQAVGRNVRILQRLPCRFQHDALLRVHVLCLKRRQPEELVVKAGDVVQVPAVGGFLRHLGFQVRIARVLAPAPGGQWGGAHATVDKQLPKLARVGSARESAGRTHNRNVALRGGAYVCLLAAT